MSNAAFEDRVNSDQRTLSIHKTLKELRLNSERRRTRGPVALLVGPTDAGKSTLCKHLLNAAARESKTPFFVDLDVGQSSLSIPGTISALPVQSPSDNTGKFDDRKLFVYFFGYKSPGHNILLYYLLIEKMGRSVLARLAESQGSSGAVIDTCGWVDGLGYESLLVAAKAFEIDVLVVLQDRSLYSRIQRDVAQGVDVIFTPKLQGVRTRDRKTRIKRREDLICEYFYGSGAALTNYTFDVPFSDIKILSARANSGDLAGARGRVSVHPVEITPQLESEVLGVSYSGRVSDEVALTSVLGFVCIRGVDVDRQIVTLLSPQPHPLPGRILLKGDLQMNRGS